MVHHSCTVQTTTQVKPTTVETIPISCLQIPQFLHLVQDLLSIKPYAHEYLEKVQWISRLSLERVLVLNCWLLNYHKNFINWNLKYFNLNSDFLMKLENISIKLSNYYTILENWTWKLCKMKLIVVQLNNLFPIK